MDVYIRLIYAQTKTPTLAFERLTNTHAQYHTNCNANHALWQVSRVFTLETHQ